MSISPDFYAVAAKYAARYRDKVIVIKFGGELAAQDDVLGNLMIQAINLNNFGARVVLVHGGGDQIEAAMKEAGIELKPKIGGVRPTDMQDLDIAHRALNELNRQIVNRMHLEAAKLGANVSAIGLGGNDGKLIVAKPHQGIQAERTGRVDATGVDAEALFVMTEGDKIPIIHSICIGEDGICMNVNADDVAAVIAHSLKASRLIMCSNTKGVLDKNNERIPVLYTDEIDGLIEDGTIGSGMINKAKAMRTFANLPYVGGVVVLDGANKQAIEEELYTEAGAGTLIQRRPEKNQEPKSVIQSIADSVVPPTRT